MPSAALEPAGAAVAVAVVVVAVLLPLLLPAPSSSIRLSRMPWVSGRMLTLSGRGGMFALSIECGVVVGLEDEDEELGRGLWEVLALGNALMSTAASIIV